MSKNDEVRLLGLNLGLSHDVCEPMVGSVVKYSWRTNQEKGCFALFLEKYATCNGCFILMHCRCQIMCVHVPLWKSIHFREIFEWAYTDGVTTFVNMWLCCWQALIFWPINFYCFTVWCLLSLCHLKRKLFKSTMMPVEVLISIVKDWYKWLVSGLVHLLSNDPFKRTGLMPCRIPPLPPTIIETHCSCHQWLLSSTIATYYY